MMNEEIKRQIELLTEEHQRAKLFLIENGFNCTSAPYVIVKQYRDDIKKHLELLRMNLED
jgi:hypothetical protein